MARYAANPSRVSRGLHRLIGDQPGCGPAGAADPVAAQANPQLTQGQRNAGSPEEAHRLMADAWKFVGYDRPGGGNAARLSTTQAYAKSFGWVPAPEDLLLAEGSSDRDRAVEEHTTASGRTHPWATGRPRL